MHTGIGVQYVCVRVYIVSLIFFKGNIKPHTIIISIIFLKYNVLSDVSDPVFCDKYKIGVSKHRSYQITSLDFL